MDSPGFQWDENKNRSNIASHGIDFRDAVRVFEKPTLDLVDDRPFDYGEARINSIGDLDGRIIVNVTHTDRQGGIRLISARPARRDERALYREFLREYERETGGKVLRNRLARVHHP